MTEDQISTLLDTQRMLVDRNTRIRQLAESYVRLCGVGVMFRDTREAFQRIADIAAGEQP